MSRPSDISQSVTLEKIHFQFALFPRRLRELANQPSTAMLTEYAESLRQKLDCFTTHFQHEIRIEVTPLFIEVWVTLHVPHPQPFPVQIQERETEQIQERETEQMPTYPREECLVEGRTLRFWKRTPALLWTLAHCWLDAGEVISTALSIAYSPATNEQGEGERASQEES